MNIQKLKDEIRKLKNINILELDDIDIIVEKIKNDVRSKQF